MNYAGCDGMKRKICFMIGHRDTEETVYPALQRAVRQHVAEYGVNEFVVGRYGQFERLAAHAVRCVKEEYPQVILTLLQPYYAEKPSSIQTDLFDHIWYPSQMEHVPYRFAIVRANRCAVEHADHLIAYVHRTPSQAGALLAYARRRETQGKMIVFSLTDFLL